MGERIFYSDPFLFLLRGGGGLLKPWKPNNIFLLMCFLSLVMHLLCNLTLNILISKINSKLNKYLFA